MLIGLKDYFAHSKRIEQERDDLAKDKERE